MKENIRKKSRLRTYNVLLAGVIIGSADCWPSGDGQPGYVIEVIPYAEQIEKCGLVFKQMSSWDDYYNSEESEKILPEKEQIFCLVETIFEKPGIGFGEIELRKRKEVFDLEIIKEDNLYSFLLICLYEASISDKCFRPSTFVHDTENFDLWQFSVDKPAEEIAVLIDQELRS